jgi:DNA end-binding protein Ku
MSVDLMAALKRSIEKPSASNDEDTPKKKTAAKPAAKKAPAKKPAAKPAPAKKRAAG